MRIGWTEIIIIVVVILLIFGGSRLSGVGKSLGKNIKEFKEEVKGKDTESAAEESKE